MQSYIFVLNLQIPMCILCFVLPDLDVTFSLEILGLYLDFKKFIVEKEDSYTQVISNIF